MGTRYPSRKRKTPYMGDHKTKRSRYMKRRTAISPRNQFQGHLGGWAVNKINPNTTQTFDVTSRPLRKNLTINCYVCFTDCYNREAKN